MNLKIAVVPGDGIGPDIVNQAIKVLDKVCELYGHSVSYETVLAGGAAIDKYGVSSDQITIEWKGSDEQPYDENNWNRVVIMRATK